MSQASAGAVFGLLQDLELIIKDEDVPDGTISIPTGGYDWQGRNEDDPVAFAGAFEFLKSMLISGGVQFGHDYYQIIDVHSIKSMLSFEDEKLGKLNGGTDVIITPFALSRGSYVKELCVLFELKTTDRVVKERGFLPSEPQALLELLAARCMSHQPKILVILTDLFAGAVAFTLNYDSDRKVFTIFRYGSLQVSQIAAFVSNFITNFCIPIFNFIPSANLNDPRQLQPLEFKKRRLSAPQVPVEWEQFVDMHEDHDSTDIERRMVTRQLFRSFVPCREDSNDRSWLSMYV